MGGAAELLSGSWGHLGASCTSLGASKAILEASWGRLGHPKSMESDGSGARWRERGSHSGGLSGRVRILGKGIIRNSDKEAG